MKKYSIYVLFVLLMLFNNNVNVINYQVERKKYSESLNNTFEDDNSKDDKMPNLCFMARKKPLLTFNSSMSNSYTFDELGIEFKEMSL